MLAQRGRSEVEVHCAGQTESSVRFGLGKQSAVRSSPLSTASFPNGAGRAVAAVIPSR